MIKMERIASETRSQNHKIQGCRLKNSDPLGNDIGIVHSQGRIAHPPQPPLLSPQALEVPRAPSYLNSRLLGYVTIGFMEPRTHYF